MNYKQSEAIGTTWTRCRAVTVNNPLIPVQDPHTKKLIGPIAYFQEEEVLSLDSRVVLRDIGSCYKEFNASSTIPLLDPSTNQPTGTIVTHADLYQILYSLYIQTATERDLATQPT